MYYSPQNVLPISYQTSSLSTFKIFKKKLSGVYVNMSVHKGSLSTSCIGTVVLVRTYAPFEGAALRSAIALKNFHEIKYM